MSNGSVVPATAFSPSAAPTGDVSAALWVNGQNNFAPISDPSDSVIWLVVLDLTNLNIVASEISDGQSVPSDVGQYVGNDQYFLYAISNNAWGSQMPQGDLYALLQKVGAGPKLAQLEQIYATIGTGYLGTFSYILAATMTADDQPGFETLSMTDLTLLPMGFLPIEVNGETIYAPVLTGSGGD
jgi:hypothetical protein